MLSQVESIFVFSVLIGLELISLQLRLIQRIFLMILCHMNLLTARAKFLLRSWRDLKILPAKSHRDLGQNFAGSVQVSCSSLSKF